MRNPKTGQRLKADLDSLRRWRGCKLCCQASFEFFDHTRYTTCFFGGAIIRSIEVHDPVIGEKLVLNILIILGWKSALASCT